MELTRMNIRSVDEKMSTIVEQNGVYHFQSASTVFDRFSDFVQLTVDNAKVRLTHLWLSDDNLSALPDLPDQIVAIALTSVKPDETVNDFFTRMDELYEEFMDLSKVCSDVSFVVYDI